MRIGIFGGSFNPPHLGHTTLASRVAGCFALDRVLFVPDHTPPHKYTGGSLANCEDRLEMCRLASSHDSRFSVSDFDVRRGGKSYSVDLVRGLAKLYPGDSLYFIMGSDMLMTFTGWYRWKDILSVCGILAAARDKDDDIAKMEEYAGRELRPYGSVDILAVEPFEASSTEIRARLRAGESTAGLLDPLVAAYIKEKGLYSDNT